MKWQFKTKKTEPRLSDKEKNVPPMKIQWQGIETNTIGDKARQITLCVFQRF